MKEVIVSEQAGQIQAEVFLDKDMELSAESKIREDIESLNRVLPRYKKIGRIVVRGQEFEKTTTKKIKRGGQKGE